MADVKGGDPWFEWLGKRRFGGSGERRARIESELRGVRDKVLERARVQPGDHLLDAGTGEGLIAFGALDLVTDTGRVTFSDISRELLDHCGDLARDLGVVGRCRFVEAAADDLPLGDGTVDVVTTRAVLIYVKEKGRAFAEFHRVLRPGGRVSIYEPINRFICAGQNFLGYLGYDIRPVAHLWGKLEALFGSRQDPGSNPMVDFDERDLIALAEEAGFAEVHLELRADIERAAEAMPWEAFVSMAANPLVPTMGEAMQQALTAGEAAQLEEYLRPLIEQGIGQRRMAVAHLWATKA
jgi:arsenite methyltransferase